MSAPSPSSARAPRAHPPAIERPPPPPRVDVNPAPPPFRRSRSGSAESTGGNSRYGELTVASLNRDALPSKAVKNEWLKVAALLRTTSPRMAPALPHSSSYNMPPTSWGPRSASTRRRWSSRRGRRGRRRTRGSRVKVVRRGQGVTPTTDVEREIMWEVRTDGTRLEPRDGAHGRLRPPASPPTPSLPP